MSKSWIDEVHAFWFEELGRDRWFGKDDALDQQIRDRFLETYEHVRDNISAAEMASEARIALAGIITLDQFPRNMFRGSPRMYESDAKALELAHAAVLHSLHEEVDVACRPFFLMPFEHSEKLSDQHLSVEAFGRLGDAEYLRYAEAHRDIILRFGRFPHRNEILGRASTPEEIEFLKQPGSGF